MNRRNEKRNLLVPATLLVLVAMTAPQASAMEPLDYRSGFDGPERRELGDSEPSCVETKWRGSDAVEGACGGGGSGGSEDPCSDGCPPPDPCNTDACEDPSGFLLGLVDGFDPMEVQTVCNKLMMLCVMAGADMHIEAINNAPNAAVHVTTGGGHNSHFFLSAEVETRTTLGNEEATLPPDHGIVWTWSDMGLKKCMYDSIEARTTGYTDLGVVPPGVVDMWTPVEAYAFDGVCETTGTA